MVQTESWKPQPGIVLERSVVLGVSADETAEGTCSQCGKEYHP